MTDARLAFDIIYSLVIGFLYAAVAWAVSRRAVGVAAAKANQAFTFWWGGLALLSFAGAVAQVIGRLDLWTFPVFLTYTYTLIVVLGMAFLGLMYYFVFLFTGRRWAVNTTIVFYVGLTILLIYWITAGQPVGLKETATGSVELDFQRDLSETTLGQSLTLLLLLPLVLGALAYSTLWFRVDDRLQRFRIITVGGSIFLWMLTALGASLGGVSPDEQEWWLYLSRAIALLATGANLIAFRPPLWLRERIGGAAEPAAEGPDAS